MAERLHEYATSLRWAGPSFGSTKTYAGYTREYTLDFVGKAAAITGSADAAFRGDAALPNPEELLVGALSSCHLLAYLAFCGLAGIEVVSYSDRASGTMSEVGGSGHFVSVVLRPDVVVARSQDVARAVALHDDAHRSCFIANSVNFPVRHEPRTSVAAVVPE